MDDLVQAALLFWLPHWSHTIWYLGVSGKIQNLGSDKVGYLIILLGLVLVLASPWTVLQSPSSAVGHLLGFIAGPTILVLLGLFKVAYSGNVPVGRLNSSDKIIGMLLFCLGIIWLSMMHWLGMTPTLSSGEINRYWLIFLPNWLILINMLIFGRGLAMLVFGDSRGNESRYLFTMSIASFTFLICAMNIDSSNITADKFREYVWLSIADIIGIAIGSILSVISFALVIFVYEKSLPKPPSIDPPNGEELP